MAIYIQLVNPCAVQNHDSVTRSFFQKTTVKAAYVQPKTRTQECIGYIFDAGLDCQHTRQGPRTPLRTHLRLTRRHTQQNIITSHTGKTLHGISQHGTPTTVKSVMTPKGEQLNNHAHTSPRRTCPGV